MWATDYPHPDGFFPGAPDMVRERLKGTSPATQHGVLAGLPAFGYPAAAATAWGTRFGAGVSRTPTAETIAASTAKPASA
jgi:hypothetical protein